MTKYGWFNIDNPIFELHVCSFCDDEKLCLGWSNPEDLHDYICEECARKILIKLLENKKNDKSE